MPATVKFKRPPKRRTISQVAADRKTTPSGPAKPTELPRLPRMKARPKRPRPQRPTERMDKREKPSAEEDFRAEALSAVAQAALAMPSSSKAGKILKGAVAGAAIGGQLGLAVEKYRASRKAGKAGKPKKGGKGGRAKLSQDAVSRPHAKPTKTKKEESV